MINYTKYYTNLKRVELWFGVAPFKKVYIFHSSRHVVQIGGTLFSHIVAGSIPWKKTRLLESWISTSRRNRNKFFENKNKPSCIIIKRCLLVAIKVHSLAWASDYIIITECVTLSCRPRLEVEENGWLQSWFSQQENRKVGTCLGR